jgi:hypothetical protein
VKAVDPARYARIEALHDAVADLDAEARADYLAEFAADDHALVAAVLAMFGDRDPGERFGGATRSAGQALLTSTQVPAGIGAYRVLGEIGHGGMGSVLLAERADGAFARRVAIKVLRGFPSPEALMRLRREREIVARLNHPNIAQLLDGGETAGGQPYLVLEYIEGERIDRHADRMRLTIDARIALFLAVCDAIAGAHRQLVVHRDIKPGNVLVDAAGQVKVLDFGIARMLEAGDNDAETAPSMPYATRDYAAPEQLRGEPVTTAADIYSLGLLLGELFAGRGDAGERRRLAPSRWRSLDAAAESRQCTAHALRRRLRGDLDAIVLMALHDDRARRYRDVQALIDDLERYRQGLPVHARHAGRWYAAGKFLRRHGMRMASVLVLGTLLATMGARYAIERRRADLEAQVVRGVTAVMRDVYAGRSGLGRRSMRVDAYVAEQAANLARSTHIQPLVRMRLHFIFGLVLANVGDLAGSDTTMARAIAMRESLLGQVDAESARMRAIRIQVLLDLGSAAAATEFAALEAVDEAVYPRDAGDRLERDSLHGQLAAARGDRAAALRELGAVYREAQALHGGEHFRVGTHALHYAEAAFAADARAASRSAAEHALRIYVRSTGADSPQARHAAELIARIDAAGAQA